MAVNALPKRYVLSGMIFVGFFVMSGLRVNLNVAIGAMVNNHTAVVDGEIICRVSEGSTSEKTRSCNTSINLCSIKILIQTPREAHNIKKTRGQFFNVYRW